MPHPKVWPYTRLSRALGDPDDPALMAHHVAALIQAAAAEGVTLTPEAVHVEVGSGETIADRPVFAALLAEWERLPKGSGGLLLVTELSRLSRGTMTERARVMDALLAAGIRIRTPGRAYDLADADDELMWQIISAMDRSELSRYRKRVKIKWDQMTREGLILTGGDRYGYRWDKNLRQLVPVPAEMEVVRGLFRDALTMSARRLGAKYGLRPSSISRLLRNPIYCGWPARHTQAYQWAGPQRSKATRWLPRQEWTWPEKPGTYEAAVTRAEWEHVQRVLDERCRARAKTGTTQAWCRDRLQFAGPGARETGGGAVQLGSQWDAADKYLTYFQQGPPRLYVAREIVHAAAQDALQRLFDQPAAIGAALEAEAISRQAAARVPPEGRVMRPEAERLAAEIETHRRLLEEITERELLETDPEQRAAYARIRDRHAVALSTLKRELAQARAQEAAAPDLEAIALLLPDLTANWEAAWAAAEEHERRQVLNLFVANIEVTITKIPGRKVHHRTVTRIDYQPWLAPFVPPLSPGV